MQNTPSDCNSSNAQTPLADDRTYHYVSPADRQRVEILDAHNLLDGMAKLADVSASFDPLPIRLSRLNAFLQWTIRRYETMKNTLAGLQRRCDDGDTLVWKAAGAIDEAESECEKISNGTAIKSRGNIFERVSHVCKLLVAGYESNRSWAGTASRLGDALTDIKTLQKALGEVTVARNAATSELAAFKTLHANQVTTITQQSSAIRGLQSEVAGLDDRRIIQAMRIQKLQGELFDARSEFDLAREELAQQKNLRDGIAKTSARWEQTAQDYQHLIVEAWRVLDHIPNFQYPNPATLATAVEALVRHATGQRNAGFDTLDAIGKELAQAQLNGGVVWGVRAAIRRMQEAEKTFFDTHSRLAERENVLRRIAELTGELPAPSNAEPGVKKICNRLNGVNQKAAALTRTLQTLLRYPHDPMVQREALAICEKSGVKQS